MLHARVILLLVCFPFVTNSQGNFKAIVSKDVVVVHEPVSIQYVIEDKGNVSEFTPPLFKGFRLASGPDIYPGPSKAGAGTPKNIVFTLEALRPGKFFIPGATATVNGKTIKSDDVRIEVISKNEARDRASKKQVAEASDYFLQPGEDPYEKMRENLFIKVLVDKTSCFVGQPVLATFKLYSRLESKSDVVKNPGFYGFTVQDIINLNDNVSSTETVRGRTFDVHTVRMVQLYPLQSGIFSIDPMEVVNKVEFSKSIVYKKTEHVISEGVVEEHDSKTSGNTVSYENHISTDKVMINVKPYPTAKKPQGFNGATGNFFLEALMEKNRIARNEPGRLILKIRGKGNFTQLTAPSIQWPQGIEGFEPVINDTLEKTQVPLKGSRTFHFPFVADKPGDYVIPAVSFTFFDPDSNSYRTVSTSVPEIEVTTSEKTDEPTPNEFVEQNRRHLIKLPADAEDKSIWLYGAIFLVVLTIIVFQLRKPVKQTTPTPDGTPTPDDKPDLELLLKPVQFSLVADDPSFYSLLQKTVWKYLVAHLHLTAGQTNKVDLYTVMSSQGQTECYLMIVKVLEDCEAAMFTKAELVYDKEALLNRSRQALAMLK